MIIKSKFWAAILAVCIFTGIFTFSTLTAKAASAEDIINSVELNPTKTGYAPLDNAVEEIFAKHITGDMTNYEKLKTIYDYMIYNYAGGSGGGYASPTAADVTIDYSLGEKPDYYSSLDSEIVSLALEIIATHKGGCRYYSSASVVFFKALGFEAYRMYGKTAMSGGGMGVHWWPIIVIDGTSYIFDAQVDDHIANGGTIKYMRFFQSVSEMSSKYVVSGSAQQYMDDFLSFANPNSTTAEIKNISLKTSNDEIRVGDKVTISVKTESEDTVLLYSYSVKEDVPLVSVNANNWNVIADKTEKSTAVWVPEKAGNYTIRVRIRDKQSLVLLDTLTFSAEVVDMESVSTLLSANTGAAFTNDTIQLSLNSLAINGGNLSGLLFTYTYKLSSDSQKYIIAENTKDTQVSFTPLAAGKYLFDVEIYGTTIFTDKGDSLEIDVMSREKLGDVNSDGKISVSDARIALRGAVNIVELDSGSKLRADIDEDGKLTAADARQILRLAVKLA